MVRHSLYKLNRIVGKQHPCRTPLSYLPSISEPVLHDVRHSKSGSAKIIAACPYKAHLEQRREHKPTDTGKKHNCQNYVRKIFTDYQQDKSERENRFAGKHRSTKAMAKRGRRDMKLQFRTDRQEFNQLIDNSVQTDNSLINRFKIPHRQLKGFNQLIHNSVQLGV